MATLAYGALLSASFNVLLERLTPELTDWINSIYGKKLDNKLLHHLRPSLIAAKAVLSDAELKQFTEPAVKDWLDELKDAVYDLEDLMDEISTRAATQNKVCGSSYTSLNLRDTDLANELEVMTDRIEFIVTKKDAFDFKKSCGTETLSWRPQLTSRVKVSDVYGRKKEKEDIIKLLFDNSDDELSVIPIVGMGGVGKTTLVQLVYNDDDVKEKFDLRAWACVSKAFDQLRMGRTIMKSINPSFMCDMMDCNLLQLHLEEELARKKFLVVLDDVWNEEYTDRDILKNWFSNGVRGCKILVTTRLEQVALMVKTIPSFYHLQILSDDQCLSIFSTHAFHSRDPTVDSCLEKIGRDVASKCRGLPLAAKVLGGLFHSKPNIEYWNIIIKDHMWDSSHNGIIPALRISYYYLPLHLKQCFVYCSLFPQDYQFDKEELILMWMAEGFLQPSKGNMSLEEVGYGYFDDLTSRSFFQPSSEHDGYFVMHDLFHELATHIAGDFYLRLEKDYRNKIGNQTRHVSCNFMNYLHLDRESFKIARTLRTFIGLELSSIPYSIGNSPHILLSNLKYLRMLSLSSLSTLKVIPDSIGEFIHLHYLDLSETKIACLPDSLCKLYNLQTLKLRFCSSLKMLPSDMQGLVNLRHLVIRGTPLKWMPMGMSKLIYLQFLSDFVVGKEQGNQIGELGGISNLKGDIAISKLENIKNGDEAYEARMMEKNHITSITFTWSLDDDAEDSQTERDILDKLQPHWGLEILGIEGYRGTIFPSWLGSSSYRNMTWLVLLNCKYCYKLPPLGQLPALKTLYIGGLDMLMRIGNELLKGNDCASIIPFASLQNLRFCNMTCWEEWNSNDLEAFPKLCNLEIGLCPKLVGNLPCQLLSLETLEIDNCPQFASCIPRYPKLQNLNISESQNVVLQEQELPISLVRLSILGYQQLESLLEARPENLHIQDLSIKECSNLSLPMNHLPPSLKDLLIANCDNVNFVLSSTALQNLQNISIKSCKYMKFSLDNDMEGLLPNLRRLDISYCHEIEAFPQEFLSSSLRELRIECCEKLISRQAEWRLPNITYLSIVGYGSVIKCFPEGCFLPATLTTIKLCDLSSLETLNCIGLQHLSSLQQLKIHHCPKLKNMLGEMLPTSLRKLDIWACPLLAERCHKKDPQIWPKISHIPLINLFNQS